MATEQLQLGKTEADATTTTDESDSSEQADQDEPTGQSGPPAELSEENLTEHTAADAVAEWTDRKEANGEHHAYLHLKVTTYRDLSGTYWGIDIEKRKRVVENDRNNYGGYWGGFSPDPEEVVPAAIDWLVETLSTPYLPPEDHDYPLGHRIRAVPIDNVRLFLSDGARDRFERKDIPIGAVEDALEECAELRPPDEYLDTLEAYLAATDTEDRLADRIRGLERAVRATFPKLSHRSSTPPSEFEDLSPTELKTELDTARDAQEEAKERRDDRKSELREMQAEYADQLRRWFLANLSEPES